MAATDVIDSASTASDRIMEEVNSARQTLAGPWVANGYSAFKDPSRIRGDIKAAIARLERATSLIDATTWPKEKDYDNR